MSFGRLYFGLVLFGLGIATLACPNLDFSLIGFNWGDTSKEVQSILGAVGLICGAGLTEGFFRKLNRP